MNTHTHIHTTRLLRFVSGVYVLKMWGGGGTSMKHVYWHDKLVSPSLHHPLTFGFFGYITWQAFLDMQPPAGPSHTALSKTVHSDIGHRRKWRLCACVQVCACVYLAWNNEWLHCQLVNNYACCLCLRSASAHCLRPLENSVNLLSLHPMCISVHICHSQKQVIK